VGRPSFLAKVLANTIFKPLPFPSPGVAEPDRRNPIALGRYLAMSLDCYTCHSADFKTLNVLAPERSPGYMAGGNAVPDPSGRPVVSTNLTPDPETGIGRWSQAQFARALRNGVRPDHVPVRPPMRLYPELTSEEAAAIHAYLMTLPPRRAGRTALPATPPSLPLPPGASEGELAYRKYHCGACHGEDGAGNISLREAGQKYATDADLAERIRNPTRFVRDSQMPPGEGVISESDYAPLAVYVRALAAAHRQ
jgi:mono/diheme cytochrome c family protein